MGVTRSQPLRYDCPRAPLQDRRWVWRWLVVALWLGVTADVTYAQVWLGVGYDGVSQAYFLSVVDTTFLTPDSVLQLKRTASAINEAQASLRTRIGSAAAWDQTTSYSSTFWQHRTTLSAYTARQRSAWGGLEYRLNFKKPHEEFDTSPYSDYLYQEFHGRLQKQFSKIGVGLRGVLETVHYPHAQDFAYDYNQFRGEWKLSRGTSPIRYQDVSFLYQRRIVPDSARVSYRVLGANLGLGWSMGSWRADAVLELSDRRHDVPEAGYDHGLARLRAHWNDDGIQAKWPGFLEVESYQYHSAVSLLADFARVDLRQRRAFPLRGGWAPFVEPGVELVSSAVDEDYYEPRLVTGTELFRLDGWWAQAEVGAGHRTYPNGDLAGFTDYWRVTTNVFIDGPLSRHLALNVMYSQDWEWHTQTSDNMSVLLFSAGLRYRL